MDQKFQQLLALLGQVIEVEDPNAYAQCLDLAFKWVDILGIDRATIRHPYAFEVYKQPLDITLQYFELVPNTPNGIPPKGALVVFDQNVSGVTSIAGHICVATGEGDANSFKSLDQNWAGVQHVTEQTHDYTGVLGWLVLRQSDNTQLQDQLNSEINAFNQCQTQLKSAQDQITTLQTQLQNTLSKQGGLQAAVDDLQLKYVGEQKENVTLNGTISDLTKSNKDYASEAMASDQKVKDMTDYISAIADELKVPKDVQNEKDLVESILQEIDTLHKQNPGVPIENTLTLWEQGFSDIIDYLVAHGANDYLQNHGHSPIDLTANPTDGGVVDKVKLFLDETFKELVDLNKAQQTNVEVATVVPETVNFIQRFVNAVEGFIFSNKGGGV